MYTDPIQRIAAEHAWSLTDPRGKRPMSLASIERVFRGEEDKIRGLQNSEAYTLADVKQFVKTYGIKNPLYAYHVNTYASNVAVLDIEPTCPDAVKARLCSISTPYMETSMSGHGIHSLIMIPDAYMLEFPQLTERERLIYPDHTFELLLSHWVTFTGNQLQPIPTQNPLSVKSLISEMCKYVVLRKETATACDFVNIPDIDDVTEANAILTHLMTKKIAPPQTDDISQREFITCQRYYNALEWFLYMQHISLTPQEKVAVIKYIAEQKLEWRQKHEKIVTSDGQDYLTHIGLTLVNNFDPKKIGLPA